MEQCLEFCRLVREKQERLALQDIAHCAQEFQLQTGFLFTILSRKVQRNSCQVEMSYALH